MEQNPLDKGVPAQENEPFTLEAAGAVADAEIPALEAQARSMNSEQASRLVRAVELANRLALLMAVEEQRAREKENETMH